MDNREYLRRLFTEKKVIVAIAVIVLACILSYVCAKCIQTTPARPLAQAGCAVVMFTQLIVVGRNAMRISAQLEQEAKEAAKKKKKKKK